MTQKIILKYEGSEYSKHHYLLHFCIIYFRDFASTALVLYQTNNFIQILLFDTTRVAVMKMLNP